MIEDTSFDEKLLNMLKPGKKVRRINGNGTMNELHHIRAIVDDEYIVHRIWLRRKHRWHYLVTSIYDFAFYFEKGVLINA